MHEAGTCIYQAEYPPQGNCKSVMEVLIVANSVHEEDAGSMRWKVTAGCTVARTEEPHTGGVGCSMEDMERV